MAGREYPVVKPDLALLMQLEALVDGETVHHHANLVGAYREAMAEANASGIEEFKDLAKEAERELRSLLVKMRLRRAGLLD